MPTRNDKQINIEFVDFEYQGLVSLFDYFSLNKEPTEIECRHKRLVGIREALRKAYTRKSYYMKKGDDNKDKLSGVPLPLMVDEQETILAGIEYARNSYKDLQSELKNVSLTYTIDTSNDQIKKPVPVYCIYGNNDTQQQFLGIGKFSRKKIDTIAYEIVAFRFDKSGGSVRKELSDCLEHFTPAPLVHRLLATCFLEMCFYKDMAILAKILDALYLSDYHRFKLYYIIQWSHRIDKELCLCQWDYEEIDKLCRIVNPNNDSGPFSKLI